MISLTYHVVFKLRAEKKIEFYITANKRTILNNLFKIHFTSTYAGCNVSDLILRLTDCIVTILFGVYLVLWLF